MSREDRSKPFHRLRIENAFNAHASKAALLEWEMEPWFVEPGPWVFSIYRTQRPDLTDWEKIEEVTNQGYAYDTDRNSYGLGVRNYYRVEVKTGRDNVYSSEALLAGNNLDRRDWRILREIVRKETLLLTRRTGARGWLLKYPTFGPASENVDPNTGEVMTSQNTDDFGTGKQSGYWGPISAYVDVSPEKRLTKLTDSGKISAIVRTGTVLAFPRFSPKDIWVNGMTDERFVVGGEIATTANVRGVPIKQSIQLELLEAGDIAYQIPVPMQV